MDMLVDAAFEKIKTKEIKKFLKDEEQLLRKNGVDEYQIKKTINQVKIVVTYLHANGLIVIKKPKEAKKK